MTKKDLTPDQMKIYETLTNAKQRCTNPNNRMYYCYGGKGIQYCLEDNKSRIQVVLEQQRAWLSCKHKYPDEPVTINRIDSNLHYEESNIEWLPMSENSRKMQKDNPNIWINGQKACAKSVRKRVKCLTTGKEYKSGAEAGRILNIKRSSIYKCCRGEYSSAGKYKGKKRVWIYI